MATYVLIPGAGGDAWEWHRLAPEIAAGGHDVVPVTLPAGDDHAGWKEYADTVVDAIGDRTNLVLVAQSLGGFTASLVADRIPVDRLVLLNAMIPKPGETGSAWWADTKQGEAQKAYLSELGISREEAEDDKVLYFHDVPADVVEEIYQRPEPQQSMTPMTQPWPLAAWPNVETRVLAGRDDRLFPLPFQRRVARERLGLEADEIPGGHMACLSYPVDLAKRLESYRA